MAAIQQVVWTVLPQGLVNPSTVRFTVLVSPRLQYNPAVPSPQLMPGFPDWQDWPKTLQNAKFHLVINGAPGAAIKPKPLMDSAVWTAMVPATTKVDNYKFTDLRGKTLLSYPIALLAQSIEGMYAQLGVASPSDFPSKGQLPPLITEIARRQVAKTDLPRTVYGALKNKDTASKYYTDPQSALELLSVYHRPLNAQTTQTVAKHGSREKVTWKNHARKGVPSKAELAAQIDFHRVCTAALDHHDLARWMGLVLEFEVPATQLGSSSSLALSIKVDRANGAADAYPVTNCTLKPPTLFDAVPKAVPNPLAGRYLDLQAKGMDLVQLDVDGGGLKLNNLGEAVPRLKQTAFDDESFDQKGDVKVATPSLRTAGLMLAQERRDLAASASFDFNGALNDALTASPPKPLVLWAEDLIRGYRVDIQDLTNAPGQWRSLMQRQVDFTFTAPGAPPPRLQRPEEGMMRLSGGSSTDGSNPDVLKIHEGVFVWRGWSLVAPEPFQSVGTPPDPSSPSGDPPATPILPPDAETPAGVPMKTRHVATPKTLPTLRFGRHYRVRVRAVDLSGESLPPGATGEPLQAQSATVVYRRYEPVAPPTIALPAQSGTPATVADGESMGVVALRTLNDTYSDPTVNPGTAARLLAAPRVAVRFAEPHGVLDTPAGKIDGGRYAFLQQNDKDLPVTPAVVTMGTAAQHAYWDVKTPIPYLPDPLAVGVAIRIAGIAGIDPATVFHVPLYGTQWDPAVKPDWPNLKTFQIVGKEVPPPADPWDPVGRIFTVPLAKGERAILRISSLVATNKFEQMQLAYLIAAAAGASQAQIIKTMMDGQHWMLTPWTTLTLVHAVQRPLVMPDISKMAATRSQVGQLDAEIEAVTPLSAHSTGRIDLRAQWNEPLDDPGQDLSAAGPYAQGHHQHVLERAIARNQTPNGTYPIRGGVHHFNDTRYRRVNYVLDASSRYREFMADAIRSHPEKMTITSDPPAPRWIASTAPPPPPQVLYVIPTFGWSRSGDANQQVSLRAGGGLRVYLDRPWFHTGFGEMLAVVLPGPEVTNDDLDYAMRTQVTQWGRDPIWTSSAIKTGAPARAASAFPLAVWQGPIGFDSSGGSVPLPADVVSTFQNEHANLPPNPFQVTGFTPPAVPPGKTVQIAPHAVGYDTDRQLWYCDIVIRPPDRAYFPFIRLALARYQPTSVQGAHLSQVVTTEFQQLSPDRLAIVNKTSSINGTVASIAVYGYAPGNAAASDAARAAVFDAKSQVLDFGSDPDLGWRDLDGQITPTDQSAPAVSFGVGRAGQVRLPAASRALPALPAAGPARLDGNYAVPAGLQSAFADARLGPAVSLGGLQGILGPGLLWSTQLYLPQTPAGGRRRVLITESESYVTGETPKLGPGQIPIAASLPRGLRIIYAEAVEI
jgi:hypothetical protein